MKNSTLLLLGTAIVLVLTSGCRSSSLKTTPLPDGSTTGGGESTRRAPNLDTQPLAPGSGVVGGGVTGAAVGDLPNDEKLLGRDQDRTRFAADTVYFDFDRADVKAAQAAKIDKVVKEFKALPPGHDLLIEGHCDERGTEGYNQALGERRALAIRELIIKTGVDTQHVFTKSLGKDQPAQVGHDEAAWSKNRRGEFILVLPKKITTTQNSQ